VGVLMKILFLVLLLCCCAVNPLFSYSGGMSYGFPMFFANFTNSPLNCHYGGVYGFSVTPGYQHLGWFAGIMISTIDPLANVYGNLHGGVLLAQELKLGIAALTFRALPGIALSASDLGAYSGHLDLVGELQADLGFYLSDWMQISLSCGIQAITNLFPLVPFQEYALYAATLGFKFTWY